MRSLLIFQLLMTLGFLTGLYGLSLRYRALRRRALPNDVSPAKGSPSQGITYALTTGMMPWAKESTRIHLVAYLRGIGFHLGIFLAIAGLVGSFFWDVLPQPLLRAMAMALTAGALLGAAGGVMRITDPHLRGISLPDDHFAVWLTTGFMTFTALGMLDQAWRAPTYVVAALTFAYVPLGKIRHCLYFFFSRVFFGRFFGRRAVFPHPEPLS